MKLCIKKPETSRPTENHPASMENLPAMEAGSLSRHQNGKGKGPRLLALFLFGFLLSLFSLADSSRAGITGSCAAVTGGLVGWWKFDDGSGTAAVDSSGGGYTGTLINSPTWTTGVNNGALSFDGATNYVETNSSSFNINSLNFTVSAWVYATGTTTQFVVDQPQSVGSTTSWLLSAHNGFFDFFGGACGWLGTNAPWYGGDLPMPSNQWNLITVVGTSTTTTLYLNGVSQGTANLPAFDNSANQTPVNNVYIAGLPSYPSYFPGKIDDVRIYNRALSASEVAQIYANNKPGDMLYNQQWRTIQYCNGGAWVSTGKTQYAAPGVYFNGSTTYLRKNSNLSSVAADTGIVTGSFWFQRLGNYGVVQTIFRANSTGTYTDAKARFLIRFTASNTLEILGADSTGTKNLDVTSGTAISDPKWHHVMYSLDLSNASNRYIYIDGAADSSVWGTYNVGGTINTQTITTPRWSLAADYGGGNGTAANLADFWFFSGAYVDLSSASNRAMFYNSGSVYLGSTGSVPTGATPQVFFSGMASIWSGATNNLGNGGVFTVQGTLGDADDASGGGGVSITSGLVGWWKLDDGSGASAADSSGNSNTGTLINSPTWTSGYLNGALGFNGTNQYVDAGNGSSLNFERTNPFTITAWVNSTNGGYILDKELNGGTFPGISFRLNPTSKYLEFFLVGSTSGCPGGDCINVATAANSVSNAVWHHVAVTYDGSSLASGVYMYIDGTNQALTVNNNGLASSILNTTDVHIGTNPSDGSNYFNGTIDDVRFYNRALSAAEIKSLYLYDGNACASPVGAAGDIAYNGVSHVMQYCEGKNWQPMGPVPGPGGGGCANPAGAEHAIVYNSDKTVMQYCDGTNWIAMGGAPIVGSTVGLVGWWKFDETSGSSASDSSGNGNTGTLINAPAWAPGTDNGALKFNGTSQYVDVGNAAALNFSNTQPFSIAAWVFQATGTNYYGCIVCKENPSGVFAGYVLYFDTGSNYLDFEMRGTNYPGDVIVVTSPGGSLLPGVWNHVVMTYDGSSHAAGVKFYINGVSSPPTISQDALPTSIINSANTTIGAYPTGIGNWFQGTIDDARVYNRVLSASEVSDLYHATGGP